MFLVAVTGGIASGKSTVTRMFADLHCPVIDADLIAREGACILPLVILRSPVPNYFLCITLNCTTCIVRKQRVLSLD